ncbi:MAG: hypothetical protein AAGB51_02730 [Planctomycetota bacterium]
MLIDLLNSAQTQDGSVIADRMGEYLSDLGESASRVAEHIPPELHALSAVAFIAGIVLWVMGGRVLKPIFSFVGLVGGGAFGFVTLPLFLAQPVFGISSPYAGMILGSVAGLIVAVTLLRFTVAVAAAGVAGIAAAFTTAAVMQHTDFLTDSNGPEPLVMTDRDTGQSEGRLFGLRPEELLLDGVPIVDSLDDEALRDAAKRAESEATRAAAQAERVRRFTNELISEAGGGWSDASAQTRLAILAGTMGGAAGGLLFGLAMPRKSAAIVTAMAGSALWLANGAWVLDTLNLPQISMDAVSPAVRLGVWGGVALLGVTWQLAAISRAKAAKE